MKTIHVCTACGSPKVFVDAFVSLNDPDDIRTYDDTFCDVCEKECCTKEVQVPDGFNIESDTYFELEMS